MGIYQYCQAHICILFPELPTYSKAKVRSRLLKVTVYADRMTIRSLN